MRRINHSIKSLIRQARLSPLLKDLGRQINKLGRRLILALIYVVRTSYQQTKKLLLSHLTRSLIFIIFIIIKAAKITFRKISNGIRQSPTIALVLVFSLFSYFEIQTIYKNSQNNGLLTRITSEEEFFIETGLPKTIEQEPEDARRDDFRIAAFREEDDLDDLEEIILTLGGSTLIIPETEFDKSIPLTRTEVEKYIVQPGDTISTIAQKFGLKWNTILWENNLNYWSIIQPGNELKILPLDGVTHKTKKGENLSYIAQKYKANLGDILKFNDLNENSSLEPGDILIIPDGTPPPPPQPVYQTKPIFVQEDYSSYLDWRQNTQCHKFVYKQCTDWVAFKWATEQGQCVPPDWSHAKYWFNKAKNAGYATGDKPRQGAILALTCTSWICGVWGHVAYVESFDASTVTFSEMNGLKQQAYSKRSLKNVTNQWQNGWKILGYIYP